MSGNTIGIMRNDQLAGRLSTFLNGWRVAQRTDANVVFCWPQRTAHAPGINYSFRQIIDMEAFLKSKPASGFVFLEDQKQFGTVFTPDSNAREIIRRHKRRLLPQHMFETGHAVFFDDHKNPLFADETLEQASDGVRGLFNRLPLRDELRQALADISQRVELSKLVAVHLRRGDIIRQVSEDSFDVKTDHGAKWMKYFVERFVPFGSYFRELEKMGRPDVIVYSDVIKDAEAFAAAYPGRAHLASKFLPQERTISPLVDAFLEFVMIGSSPVAISSVSSLFSRYSAWLSDKSFIDLTQNLRATEIIAEVAALFHIDVDRARQETAVEFFKHYRVKYFSNDDTEDAQALDRAISYWGPVSPDGNALR